MAKGITLPITYKADLGGLKSAEDGLKKFGKVAAGISAAAVGAVTAIGVKGVQAFADFDSKLNQSVAIMGDVSDALRNDMSDAAREVAKTTTFSAAQAAESYFFLASAGLDAEQSIAALPKVAAFAQAGMFDMATATDLLTDAQSALGLTSDDAAENLENMAGLGDVLVKANTLANASVQQFSEALTNKAGASMNALNMEMEEGVAVLAVFADQGIKGSQAGTTFNAAIRGLTNGALNNAEAFDRLGVEVFDSEGAMNNMADIVADLEVGLGDLSVEEQRAELAALGFTEETLAGTLALIGNSDALRDYESELRNAGGTVDDVAAKQLETFSGQLSLLQSGFEDTFLSIGAIIVPILVDLMESLAPVMDIFGEALVSVFQELAPVITEIAGLIPGLMEAFIPMIPIVGDLATIFFQIIEKVLPIFVELFAQLLPIIAELVPILGDVFLQVLDALLPVFLQIIDAIIPIVVALLPVLAELIVALAPVIIKLVEAFLPLIEMILPMLVSLIEFLTPILVFIGELLGIVLVAAVGFFVAAFEKAGEFFEWFGKFFQNLWLGIQIIFATTINGIITGFENFVNFFIDGFNLLLRAINVGLRAMEKEELDLVARVTLGRLDVPELIPMALGGIVTGPTAALIGEAGPEAVIPLDRMGNMGGGTYNITVNAGMGTDGAQLGEQIVRAIRKYERVSGPVFAGA
jgi:TP901 family phage tail tape measure protein